MADIVTLKDKNNTVLYPQTKTDAVFDDNGDTVDEIIGEYIGHPALIHAVTDSDDKLLEGTKADGTKIIGGNLEVNGTIINDEFQALDGQFERINSHQWIQVTVDAEGKILEGIRTDGKKKIMVETAFDGGVDGLASEDEVEALADRVTAIENSTVHALPNEYYGKTINWLGDSIVAGDDFDEEVVAYFGMTENDYGINGSTIAKDTNDTRNSMAVRYSEMSNNADVIAVSGGTNDYQYSWTPFGQFGDSSTATFYGALDVLCRGLIAKYPTKLIFFTTPIKRNQNNNGGGSYTHYDYDTHQDIANSLGKTLKDYCTAIKEVCAKYSIPVCDMYSESMLNPNMSAQANLFDNIGTHPAGNGITMMARRVRGFMKQLC